MAADVSENLFSSLYGKKYGIRCLQPEILDSGKEFVRSISAPVSLFAAMQGTDDSSDEVKSMKSEDIESLMSHDMKKEDSNKKHFSIINCFLDPETANCPTKSIGYCELSLTIQSIEIICCDKFENPKEEMESGEVDPSIEATLRSVLIPYMLIEVNGVGVYRTRIEIFNNTKKVVWDEKIGIQIFHPFTSIHLKLMDKDFEGTRYGDENLGTVIIPIQLIQPEMTHETWIEVRCVIPEALSVNDNDEIALKQRFHKSDTHRRTSYPIDARFGCKVRFQLTRQNMKAIAEIAALALPKPHKPFDEFEPFEMRKIIYSIECLYYLLWQINIKGGIREIKDMMLCKSVRKSLLFLFFIWILYYGQMRIKVMCLEILFLRILISSHVVSPSLPRYVVPKLPDNKSIAKCSKRSSEPGVVIKTLGGHLLNSKNQKSLQCFKMRIDALTTRIINVEESLVNIDLPVFMCIVALQVALIFNYFYSIMTHIRFFFLLIGTALFMKQLFFINCVYKTIQSSFIFLIMWRTRISSTNAVEGIKSRIWTKPIVI